jgi:hypothetical protein
MKNSKVSGIHIPSATANLKEKDAQGLNDRLDGKPQRTNLVGMTRRQYSKITDEVADSDHYVRNEPIPFGLDLFPNEWRMRYSDLFYPAAKGGGIYIDTPGAPWELVACAKKHEAYAAKGVRYTYVGPHEDAADVLMRLTNKLPAGSQGKETTV